MDQKGLEPETQADSRGARLFLMGLAALFLLAIVIGLVRR